MENVKKPGIREVAKAAGVSVATVSRVLANAGYPVTEDTRKRVLAAVDSLGFVPNLLARTFATARTDTVGVAMPRLNAYYAKMLMGIEQRATENGLSILLSLVGDDPERREKALDQFLARRLDGIVICSGAGDTPMARGPSRIATPTVIIGQQPEMGFATVTVDNHRAAWLATDHLVARGHTDIVLLTSRSDWFDFRDRLAGFEARLAEEGRKGQVIDGIFTEADAHKAVTRLIAEKTTATAILAATDRQALGALAALSDLGIAVPGQMAVAGFDNLPTSEFIRPSLTSVDMPADDMGALAISMLIEATRHGTLPQSQILQPQLVIRKST